MEEIEKALLVAVNVNNQKYFLNSVEELRNLTYACNMDVLDVVVQNLENVNNATYIGTGKVKEIKELGSHHMFIAEVLAINSDEKYIDEKGAFDISKCDLIAYSNGHYYSLGKKLGKFGFSVQKKKSRKYKKS